MLFRNRIAAAALLLPALLLGCNEQPKVSSAGNSTGGSGTAGVTGKGGSGNGGTSGGQGGSGPIIILPDGGSAGGAGGSESDAGLVGDAPACGIENFKLERLPPELLLVLDRSSSMERTPFGAPVGSTLWTDTLTALDDVVKGTQMAVHWGLTMFPAPTGCMVPDGAEVAIAPNNADMVLGKARMTGTNNLAMGMQGTPTDTAMLKATEYFKSRAALNKNPKYILLATDGQPTCVAGAAGNGGPPAIAAITAAAAAGFKTYVIGIAIEGSLATLNEMAVAGGVPRNDPANKFYPAANKADLTAALNVITGQVSNCVFPLQKAPPDKDNVRVTVDNDRVPPSATPASMTDGWSYTSDQHTAIQLNGTWCERVKTQAGNVGIAFGCPSQPVN